MTYVDYTIEADAMAALKVVRSEGYAGMVVAYNANWWQLRYWA